MGRKKIGVVTQASDAFELKPFCYYCDREFDTVKTLITHQRTKHFNCAECGLKFDTVTGLRVHMLNAYKKTMKEVPGSIPGRENPDIVVHGMEGLPKGLVEERTRKAMAERVEKEKSRDEDMQKRLKEVNAARAAEARSAVAEEAAAPEPKRPAREQRHQQQATAPFPTLAPPMTQQQQPPAAPAQVARPPPIELRPGGVPHGDGAWLGDGSQAMPGLSPYVQKLLSGEDNPGELPVVPGLLGHSVPPSFGGMHPVALQVLAFAGCLPVKGAASTSPALVRA